jgi:DNA-directed RNA polymerase beta' subunit
MLELINLLKHSLAFQILYSNFNLLEIQHVLKLLNCFNQTNINLQWLLLKYLPVLPADLRPFSIVQGMLSIHSINYFYAELINVNFKLQTLSTVFISEEFLKKQKNLLQRKLNNLFFSKSTTKL